MAFYTKLQVKQILDKAPPNLDKGKIVEALVKQGNELEGFQPPVETNIPAGYTDLGPPPGSPPKQSYFQGLTDPNRDSGILPYDKIHNFLAPTDMSTESRFFPTVGKTIGNQAKSVANLAVGVAGFLDPISNAKKIGSSIGGAVNYQRQANETQASQQAVKDTLPALQAALEKLHATTLTPEQEAFRPKAQRIASLERNIREAGGQPVTNPTFNLDVAKALPGALYQNVAPAFMKKGIEANNKGGIEEGIHAAVQSIAEDPQQLAPYFLLGKKTIETRLPTLDKGISAVGGAPGKVLGKAASAVTEPIKTALEYKYSKDLYNKYNEVFTQTKSANKSYQKSTATGKDPAQFGAENGYIVDVKKGKIDAQPTIQKVQAEYIEPRAKVLDDMLEAKDRTISPNSYVSLDEVGKLAKAGLEKNPLAKASGNLTSQQAAIDATIAELKTQYGDKVSNQTLNTIKKAQWKESQSFDLTKPKFKADVEYQIGRAAKDIIEQRNPEAAIQQLNGEIGDAADFAYNLRKVDGNTSPSGGVLTKLASRTIGSIAGSHAGPFGSIAGALAGNYIAELMQNNSIAGPIKSSILENMKPDSSLYQQAQATLQQLKSQPAYPELGQTIQQTIVPQELVNANPNSTAPIRVNNYQNPNYPKYIPQ